MRAVRYLTGHDGCILEKAAIWSGILMEFQKYSDFEGVFYMSGMKRFKIQMDIIHHRQKTASLDIIAVDDEGRCCNVEVTTNRTKDIGEQLAKHARIPVSDIMEQIGFTVSSSPDVISCANFEHDTDYCSIVISDNVRSVLNSHMLANPVLAENLPLMEEHRGYPVSTKFTLVPEPNEYELRSGISSILYQMSYGGLTLDPREIVDRGLDFLSAYYGTDGKRQLAVRVARAMDDLCDMMPYAFRHRGDSYEATAVNDMGRKKGTFSNDLKVWMESPVSGQKKLDEFPDSP